MTGPLTDTELRATPVVVTEQSPTAVADVVVAVGVINVQVVATNTNRKALIISNCAGGRIIYLRFGATAATTSRYAVQLLPGSTYEMLHPAATMAIQAIANGDGGILLVHEFT